MKYLMIIILILFTNELFSDVIVQMKKHINIENNSSVILQMKKLTKIEIENKFQTFEKETKQAYLVDLNDRVYYNNSNKYIYIDNIENYHQLIVSDVLGNLIIDRNIYDDKSNYIQAYLNKGVYFIILIDNNKNKYTHKIIN